MPLPVELVRVITADGLHLDGAFQLPSQDVVDPLSIDAFLLVHGTGGNFYSHGVLESFAHQAAAAGAATLRINTRGHDGISSISGTDRSIRGGATYEVISECTRDLVAGMEFLHQRGYGRIALAGHSMGGVKSSYTLAHQAHPAVRCLIVISSPRFCHARFMANPNADRFRADWAAAQQWVAAGDPEHLMQVAQPLPFLATAAGFLEKYGPEDPYDLLRFLPLVPCPTLVIIGSRSPASSIAFEGLPEAVQDLSRKYPHLQLELVEGANTNYTGQYEVPFQRAEAWIRKCLP